MWEAEKIHYNWQNKSSLHCSTAEKTILKSIATNIIKGTKKSFKMP